MDLPCHSKFDHICKREKKSEKTSSLSPPNIPKDKEREWLSNICVKKGKGTKALMENVTFSISWNKDVLISCTWQGA